MKIALAVGGGARFFALLAVTDQVAVVLVGVASFLWGPYYVVERSLVQRLIPEDRRGRVMGARTAISSMGFPLGSATAGALLAGLDPKVVILVLALAYLILAMVPLFSPALRSTAG